LTLFTHHQYIAQCNKQSNYHSPLKNPFLLPQEIYPVTPRMPYPCLCVSARRQVRVGMRGKLKNLPQKCPDLQDGV